MEVADLYAFARDLIPGVDVEPLRTHITSVGLATLDRLVVHQVRPSVARLVDATDLHTFPGELPTFMRRPGWIVEASRPETGDILFGNTIAVAGHMLGGAWFLLGLLLGLKGEDDVIVARMSRYRVGWQERDVEPEDDDALPMFEADDDRGGPEARAWAKDAMRFAVVLGLLLEAESSPLQVLDERDPSPASRGPRRPGEQAAPVWITRRVYLDEQRARRARSEEAPASEAPTGRLAVESAVTGHLKRQPFGPGRKDRKWIYVQSYEARRWVAPGRPVKVVVGLRGER